MPLGEAVAATANLLVWEVGTSALALGVARRVANLHQRLTIALSIQITFTALVATAFTFAGINHPWTYLTVGALCLIGAAYLLRELNLEAVSPKPRDWLPAVGVSCALALLLAASMRPVAEIDSLYNLHYVMDWLRNRTTPYEFAYNYVAFWELTYLPGFALTRSDLFVWFQSLKPVALLALALWLIAGELQMPRHLRIWSMGALLAFPHLWLDPSGVSTIKNDMIAAAGQGIVALVVVRAAKRTLGRLDAVWLAFAAVFLSVKFSGPVYLVVGGLVAAAVCWHWLLDHWKMAALTVGGALVLWLPAVGHYYLRNLIEFGNPLYPFEINAGFLHLPGRADLSYSSILANLDDPRLWRAFFLPEGGMSPIGVLFPLALVVVLVGSVVLVLRWRKDVAFALGLYQLVVWLIYFRSIYSASGYPGDLQFVLNNLNSTRYVEGALLVAELFLVAVFARSRLVYLLLAAQGLSRMWLVLTRTDEINWVIAGGLGVGFAAAGAVAAPRLRATAAAAMALLTLGCGAYLIEERRPEWLTRYQPIYSPLYDAPPETVYYIIDDETGPQQCARFPLM
ncbi:MAG: hypothetical protein GY953_56590, partial [bacterium]|nr:hypothetical protein [bacterium]